MILTTMIKLYKTSPEIGSNVIKFFQLELNSLDIELQTRSFEYLNIIQLAKVNGNTDILQILFEPMPPFNSKSNPLLKRLGSLPASAGSTTLINTPSEASSSTPDLLSKEQTLPGRSWFPCPHHLVGTPLMMQIPKLVHLKTFQERTLIIQGRSSLQIGGKVSQE